MRYSDLVAGAQALRSWLLALRTVATILVCAVTFGVCATIAYAETNVTYWNGVTYPGDGGGDFQVVYRNWNDSCSNGGFGTNYDYTKSYYTLGNGTWVAAVETYNYCQGSPAKAHLGPSTNYGYTYLQSKCLSDGINVMYLVCKTTRP
jgi:hypothetical protein